MADKPRSEKIQASMSLITCLVAFVINAGINFFVTPYIIEQLGTDAYGFIGLANEVVNYANILAMALNTMASRFITFEYHSGNKKKAQTYINSVLVGDLVLCVAVAIFAFVTVWNLESFINIPKELVTDVKITFSIVFFNYMVSISTSVFSCGAFVKNRMDKIYVRNIFSYIIKLLATVLLLSLFDIKVYFISITALVYTVFIGLTNYILTRKLLPEIKIGIKGFKLSAVKEILSSGVWMSILSLANLMLSGINLLLSNIFIGTTETGFLSAAKNLPNYISQLGQQLGQVFSPKITYLYAKGKKKEMLSYVKKAMRMMSFVVTVPIAGFISFSKEFYTLWFDSYSANEIKTVQILSIIIIIPYLFNAYISPMIQIHTAMNKVKIPVIATLIIGIANILTVLPFGFTDNLTLYLLTGIGSSLIFLSLVVFYPLYESKLLNERWYVFYPTLLKNTAIFIGLTILYSLIKHLLPLNSWTHFIISIFFAGAIGFIFTFLLTFSKSEYTAIISTAKNKLLNKKNN